VKPFIGSLATVKLRLARSSVLTDAAMGFDRYVDIQFVA
jgi:hypothetical protein